MGTSTAQLADQYSVTAVSPFGVMIRPRIIGTEITDVPVAAARDLVRQQRVLILRGFAGPCGPEELERYATSGGQLLTWSFGAVLELVEQNLPVDHIFDNTGVSLHWDGMFVDRVPEFQIFQCIKTLGEEQGGRTIFCDTTRVLGDADAATRWQAGDVVIADNYTLLHGREPYLSRCGRHLRRVHVLDDPPLMNPALRKERHHD